MTQPVHTGISANRGNDAACPQVYQLTEEMIQPVHTGISANRGNDTACPHRYIS